MHDTLDEYGHRDHHQGETHIDSSSDFKITIFRHLLDLEKPRFSVVFMHVVLLHMINRKDQEREIRFKLNGVEV